jgi:hypothetical protein
MEMLTKTGWRGKFDCETLLVFSFSLVAINSIESIIMTVRAQIGSKESGGRLELGSGNSGNRRLDFPVLFSFLFEASLSLLLPVVWMSFPFPVPMRLTV